MAQWEKICPPVQETQVRSRVGKIPWIFLEDTLEEDMAAHSGILAWETPWTEEPSGLQFMGLQRVGRD